MRSTPQRRAILGAFRGGQDEHLSADEIFARASETLPDLSRGTVYATLAEFTEAGLLAAYGTPEPVRYETNTGQHAHFRCRWCLRLFDVEVAWPDPAPFEREGHRVERLDLRGEGICHDCLDYEAGLRAGARAVARTGPSAQALAQPDAGAVEVDSPLGPLLIAATPAGLIRLAFPEHGDAETLRNLARRRRHPDVEGHLRDAGHQLTRYFAEEPFTPICQIDWEAIDEAASLQASMDIPYGARQPYHRLTPGLPARRLGRTFGANPIAILIPCHRVSRGVEMPGTYVGGPERRSWLLAHERQSSGPAPVRRRR